MGFFISNANAEPVTTTTTAATSTPATTTGTTTPDGGLLGAVLPFAFIFVVFYFLILRPQQRKFKLHQAMVTGIRRGDKVITSGGIIGKVNKVDTDENILHVEIADDVVVKVLASTVSSVVGAEKPVNDNAKAKEKAKK